MVDVVESDEDDVVKTSGEGLFDFDWAKNDSESNGNWNGGILQ